MKKALLFSAIAAGFGASAQTFTVDDTLYSGLTRDYYIMDSNAVDLAAITGAGVTWNYSTLTAYGTTTIADDIIDASSPDFPMAVYNDDLTSGASIFFSNSEDSVTVHGYVFTADGMEVILRHSDNPLKSMEFPMAVGDNYTDAIAGEVEIMGFSFETIGSATITLDGSGTLNVAGNIHSNVIRVKMVEAIDATITFPPPGGTGTVTRTIYSYYDLADNKQAILIHANIDITSTAINDNYTAVYYGGELTVGMDEPLTNTLSIYPNPANNVVTITTDGTAETMTLVNALGQVVATVNNPQMTEAIDVSNFESGIYIIRLTNDGVISEQKLIVE